MTTRNGLLLLLVLLAGGVGHASTERASVREPVVTATDLFSLCASSSEQDRRTCHAYVRGFSDGNRWLLQDEPIVSSSPASQAVCVPNAVPIERAAGIFVAAFRESPQELNSLSPYRALSRALASRFPCKT